MTSVQLFAALITQPRRAFTELEKEPRFALPMWLVLAATVGMILWYYSSVDVDWLINQALAARPMTAAQRAQAAGLMSRGILLGTALISGVIALFVVQVVQAFYFYFIYEFMEVQLPFRKWFALTWWCSLPQLISVAVTAVLLLVHFHAKTMAAILSPLSVNELFFHFDPADGGYSLLTSLTLVQLLTLVLMVIRRADLVKALVAAQHRGRTRTPGDHLRRVVLVRLPALGFDQDTTVFDADFEGAGRFVGRRGQRLTGLQAEAREVARTDDLAILDIRGGEGFAIVGAAILHGVEVAAAAGDHHRDAGHLRAEGAVLAHTARPIPHQSIDLPCLEHPGLQAGRLSHHGLVPGWIEHQFDHGLTDGGNQFDLVRRIVHQNVAHAAARGGERHLDIDTARAVVLWVHGTVVDQSEFDDIDRNFRIKAGAQLRPDRIQHILIGGIHRQLGNPQDLFADGIGIGAGQSIQIAIDIQREAAAQGLGNVSGLAGLQGDFLSSRYHHRLYFAVDDDGFVFVRSHGAPAEEDSLPPSVEIVPP